MLFPLMFHFFSKFVIAYSIFLLTLTFALSMYVNTLNLIGSRLAVHFHPSIRQSQHRLDFSWSKWKISPNHEYQILVTVAVVPIFNMFLFKIYSNQG